MKIIRYRDDRGNVHWGDWISERSAQRIIGDVLGDFRIAPERDAISILLSPIDPPNVYAIGRNYREHAQEMNAKELPSEPLIFLKATTSIIGPEDDIVIPRAAPNEIDFEAELAVVIARQARNISEENALEYVLGYTCANDVSARDCQRINKQWARAKSFDTFCPLGPAIIPRSELNPDSLGIRSILNGRMMQESNTSEMLFSVRHLISYLSHQFTLPPGTLILTGTPAGVGAARTPPVFLQVGDEIAIEIDGIGRLKNKVKSE